VNWLKAESKKFLFLTNSSAKTLRELSEKLGRMGLDVDESISTPAPVPRPLFSTARSRRAPPM
jgi:NagD protein